MTIKRIEELIKKVEENTLEEKDQKDLLIILKNAVLQAQNSQDLIDRNKEFYHSK